MSVDIVPNSEPGKEPSEATPKEPMASEVDEASKSVTVLPVPPVATPIPIADPVTVEAAYYQSLDPRYITVERIAGAILGLCVAGVAVLGFGIWLIAAWPPGWIYWVSLAGLGVALSLLTWAIIGLPAAEHRRASWRISESGLEIRRGIFWRQEITVPRARVQHTDVRQGPLQRQYGIAKLVVHTAGTVAASVELSGLSLPIAKWLRDTLIDELRGTHDAV